MNSIGTLHNRQQMESLACSHLILLLGVALPNTGNQISEKYVMHLPCNWSVVLACYLYKFCEEVINSSHINKYRETCMELQQVGTKCMQVTVESPSPLQLK